MLAKAIAKESGAIFISKFTPWEYRLRISYLQIYVCSLVKTEFFRCSSLDIDGQMGKKMKETFWKRPD